MTSDSARTLIADRYRAGERLIIVSPATYQAYGDSLIALTRTGPPQPPTNWLWYKDAKVTTTLMTHLTIKPCELKDANAFITRLHRHHKPVVGHRFSVAVWTDICVGVAVVGRPVARNTNQRTVLEVTRLCTDGTPNACSALYAAAARVGKELGYEHIQTFLLASESGVSLRATGWLYEQSTSGGDWNCVSRGGRRTDQPQCPKQRWGRDLQ